MRRLRNHMAMGAILLLTAGVCLAGDAAAEARKDVQLRAMLDELARSKTLQLNNLDKPYFVEYDSGDSHQILISANLGGILSFSDGRFRVPRLEVRVGDYNFDNSNSIFSGFPRFGVLPIDDDYQSIRNSFWLATDSAYKSSADQITRKRNALRDISDPDKTPDFSPAKAVQILQPPDALSLDSKHWEDVLRRVSARFVAYPNLTDSAIRLRAIASTYRLVNTEGTMVRVPQELSDIAIRAAAQAPDGSYVWNHLFLMAAHPSEFASEEQLAKATDAIANETQLLAKAPLMDDYSGPVLFEQEAAAEMMASVLSDAVRLHRKPLAPPGAENVPQELESVWSAKLGAKVLPDWLSVYDDPLQEQYHKTNLVGAYQVDDEGVPAKKVMLVEKGVLKDFLSSRQPIRDRTVSNGHGRLPAGFGAQQAVLGNLFVDAKEVTPEAQMKTKLLERVKAGGLKYGIVIRRLDFPYTATFDELQSLVRQLQKSGFARTLASPILAYRVYLDGHEELVRGIRFKEFSAKDLRDLAAASDRSYVLNYVNNGSGFNFADVGSDATTSSVICPSLLFDSLDLARAENEPGKLPIVAAPALLAIQ